MSIDQVDEQAEAEKLRRLRFVIEKTLRAADVCGHVVLIGRAGRFETFMHLRATWSQLHFEKHRDGDALRLRANLADYGGDLEKAQQHRAWSVGAVSGLGAMLARDAMGLLDAADAFDKATGATHTPFKRDDPRDE